MLAAPKHGFVVLAVPKSGSTALEHAFRKHAQLVTSGPPSLKHVTAVEFDERFAPLLRNHGYERTDYAVTAVVREPVSWLASWWRYRSRPGIVGKATYVGDLGFDEFAGRVVAGEIRLRPQRDYVTTDGGGLAVDRLWRYDDLDSAFAWMRDQVGKKKIRLRQRNVSPERQHEVSASTRALIEEAYASDVALYRSIEDGGRVV
ncbi:sulfotransferase family protein [Nocardioides acrostichi]|uniref:Gamma-glutamyl kinase n=1 Tax=Nocardioides acrostichi TaxID=2784339 RepID=A0A930YEF2_9ACTN|nr:hypothetical protein [Nocardioides acrostichi]MBF4163434.1 hypothetical protein [Nocardioides acrostichi]